MQRMMDTARKRLSTADVSDTVLRAAALMASTGTGAVAVMDRSRLVGLFTCADLATRVVAPGREPARTPLATVMTGDPPAVDVDGGAPGVLKTLKAATAAYVALMAGDLIVGLLTRDDVPEIEAACLAQLVAQDEGQRRAAALALAAAGNAHALPQLLYMLGDQSTEVRRQAARAIEGIGGELVVSLLFPLVQGRSATVRDEATRILQNIGNLTSDGILRRLESADLQERLAAITVAGGVRSVAALQALGRILSSGSPEERVRVATALGQRGDRRSLPLLARAIHDRDPALRSAALKGVQQLAGNDLGVALVRLLDDTEPEVARLASEAVWWLRPRGAAEALQARVQTWPEQLQRLGMLAASVLGARTPSRDVLVALATGVVELVRTGQSAQMHATELGVLRSLPAALVIGAVVEFARTLPESDPRVAGASRVLATICTRAQVDDGVRTTDPRVVALYQRARQ